MRERELHFERRRMEDRPPLDTYPDATIYQSAAWLDFVRETQGGKPVVAALLRGTEEVGWFTGLLIRKSGVRILGSPFPGWSTSYMGFNLRPGISRGDALSALMPFAFRGLGCHHLEVMDRRLTLAHTESLGCAHRVVHGYEIDLSQEEDTLFARMSPACRRCVRKATREGVIVESAEDAGFADDYYEQLKDVFAKQGLVPTYSVERVRALINHVLPAGQLLLLRACDRSGLCIATGVFPAMFGTMYFWGGASWRNHQNLRPNEAIQWYAMNYWKERGMTRYDMGGGGSYKRKYGGEQIAVPWVRKSRHWWIGTLREGGRRVFGLRQRLLGLVGGRR